ncbi:hypothetical protein CU669_09500 [Paramagnetospirillum kuznetsovii]|uniref:Uncharacterized protein n=1 Tax=Paramagnetospirillum kuznetsovii TaxID=2053833 RepID=A0A364NZ42_9PROT|nr:hypothetical protein [Paramagnetospirillum kuznetsovii]RAU22341.1 hypothetical protein CU669_09500 [Paramagnetospirillum kuznetsovii]
MRLPSSPLGIFATLCAVIVPAGAGLTAPVWLMVMGVKLDKAASVGAEIVGVTVLACLGLFAAYWVLLRPRILASLPATSDGQYAPVDNTARDRFVHMLVWVLFILPFILVIVSFIFGQLEKLSID